MNACDAVVLCYIQVKYWYHVIFYQHIARILISMYNLDNPPPPQIDHLPISITLFGSEKMTYNAKPTTSLNEAYKVVVGRFRELLLYLDFKTSLLCHTGLLRYL